MLWHSIKFSCRLFLLILWFVILGGLWFLIVDHKFFVKHGGFMKNLLEGFDWVCAGE